MAEGKYTAEQLAFRAGVPLRTVRYYVQEKLIDPPLGRGRGAHYDDGHLHQIQRARFYQYGGFDNATIRKNADELEAILKERGLTAESVFRLWGSFSPGGRITGPAVDEDTLTEMADAAVEADEVDVATAIRIPMAPGVELLVAKGVDLPSPRSLVDIALLVRKLFNSK